METVKDVNIIYSSPRNGKSIVISHDNSGNNLCYQKLHNLIGCNEGIETDLFKIIVNGKIVNTKSSINVPFENGQNTVFVTLSFGMVGGKGGFGSMLRAIGAQIEKTTNKEACRDLSGRRIRDVNIERRFQNWIAKAAERKKEQVKRKKEKLEKLRRVPKFEFKDDEYFKVRSEIPEKIDAALEYALQKTKVKSSATSTVTSATVTSTDTSSYPCNNSSDVNDVECKKPVNVSVPVKRKYLTKLGLSKKSRLWVSDDIEVSDEDDVSQDEVAIINADENGSGVKPESIDNAKREAPQLLLKGEESLDEPKEEVQEKPSITEPIKVEVLPEQLELDKFISKDELVALGLDRLKAGLMFLGMKCGGTLEQRAERLWSIRGVDVTKIPKNLLAPKSKK